jgi:molecular chaperone GrpE (heat shock protein)
MFIKEITQESLGLTTTDIDLDTIRIRLAVRGIIVNADDNIALIRWKQILALPWGWTDGQPLEASFIREIREEVGATLENISMIWITREYRLSDEYPMIVQTHFFSASVIWTLQELQLQPEEIEEGHEVVWLPIEEVKSLMRAELLERTDHRSLSILHRDLSILEEYTATLSPIVNSKIKELEDIAKNAQYSYIMLKSEFDSLVRRTENDAKESKVNQLIELAKKLTPIIDQLGQTVAHIPVELTDNTWAAGVKLVYENAVKTLATLGITLIPTIGEEPDMELHEPLSVEPTDEEALKGKITKEFQPGYVYEKDGIKKVITAAKVIVWN